MSKIKIALVGAGNIGRVHLGAYKEVEEVEIAAICDINAETLNKTADKYEIEKRYTDIKEMLEKETELDAVDVCVWNCNHRDCVIAALNAGLHVLCEKPMAYSTEQAEEMKACAEKNGKLLMIGFVMRFGNTTTVAKDFIDNGYLGDIYYAKAQYMRRNGAPKGWFGDKARSGGGPVIDLGVHVIDRARYFMGSPKPVSVYAAAYNKLGNRENLKTDGRWTPDDANENDVFDVEDFASAIIRFDNGAIIQLETSYSVNAPGHSGLYLYGDKGGFSFANGDELTLYTEMNGFMTDVKIDKEELIGGKKQFVAEMQHFADCILGKCECMATADDGINVMKILDAIYESAKTGHEVIIK